MLLSVGIYHNKRKTAEVHVWVSSFGFTVPDPANTQEQSSSCSVSVKEHHSLDLEPNSYGRKLIKRIYVFKICARFVFFSEFISWVIFFFVCLTVKRWCFIECCLSLWKLNKVSVLLLLQYVSMNGLCFLMEFCSMATLESNMMVKWISLGWYSISLLINNHVLKWKLVTL